MGYQKEIIIESACYKTITLALLIKMNAEFATPCLINENCIYLRNALCLIIPRYREVQHPH